MNDETVTPETAIIPVDQDIVPTPRCKKHSRYRALRVPRNGCPRCMSMYEYAKKMGLRREVRRKRAYIEAVATAKENL